MSELAPLSDSSAEVERSFLWQEIVETIRSNADKLGVLPNFDPIDYPFKRPTKVVLAEAFREDKDRILLWAETSDEMLISKAIIIFVDEEDYKQYTYEINQHGIGQYSEEPTSLDQEDLQDLRADLAEAEWDGEQSQLYSENWI